MTISKKDQKLLVYLIAVGLLAIVYFYVAKPKMDANDQMQIEIDALKKQVDYYNEIYINQAEYEDKIAKTQVEYNETLNKFFGGLNQENTLMNIKGIEEATNTWISRISFQDAQIVMGGSEEEPVSDENSPESQEETQASSRSTGITGYKQDLNIDFSCKYADFKKFIEYMQNYDQRLFVSTINATYSVDSDLVSGTIVLSQYAVTGVGNEYSAPDLSNIQTGVDNIFTTLRESSESDSDMDESGTIMESGVDIGENMDGSENPDESDGDENVDSDENQDADSQDDEQSSNNEPSEKSNKPKSGGII